MKLSFKPSFKQTSRFLHERNANLEDSDKDGMTPIMVGAEVGRADNLEFLVKTIEEGRKLAEVELDEKTAKKLGRAGINLASRNSSALLGPSTQQAYIYTERTKQMEPILTAKVFFSLPHFFSTIV